MKLQELQPPRVGESRSMAPGPGQDVVSHPQRPPAHKSVSSRHTPPNSHSNISNYYQRAPSQTSYTIPSSDQANPPSGASPRPPNHRQSSGESSDAGKWFENSNNNIMQSNPSFVDSEWYHTEFRSNCSCLQTTHPSSFEIHHHQKLLQKCRSSG